MDKVELSELLQEPLVVAEEPADVVEVRRAEQTCIFARVHPPSTFYARLTQRLRREEGL